MSALICTSIIQFFALIWTAPSFKLFINFLTTSLFISFRSGSLTNVRDEYNCGIPCCTTPYCHPSSGWNGSNHVRILQWYHNGLLYYTDSMGCRSVRCYMLPHTYQQKTLVKVSFVSSVKLCEQNFVDDYQIFFMSSLVKFLSPLGKQILMDLNIKWKAKINV